MCGCRETGQKKFQKLTKEGGWWWIPAAVSAGDVASVAAVAVSWEAKVNVWKINFW